MSHTFDKTSDLIRVLREIGEAASDASERVNYGGCAFYAALVSKFLQHCNIAHEGVAGVTHSVNAEADLVCLADRSINRARNLARQNNTPSHGVWLIHEWACNGVLFDHVGLRVTTPCGNFAIHDCTHTSLQCGTHDLIGRHPNHHFPMVDGGLTPAELYAIGLKWYGWNTTFREHREVIQAIRPIMLDYASEHIDMLNASLNQLAC